MLLTSLWIPDVILLLLTISILSFFYATRNFNYWKNRNVFYNKPLPFLGNYKDVITLKKPIGHWLLDAYKKIQKPYFGIFVLDEPILVIKSPQLVKDILIKDFSYFADKSVAFPQHDKLLSNFLFLMPNPKWKSYRSQLSPAFTSGKLKMMFPTVAEVGENFQRYLDQNQGVLDAKEAAAKYATDVIAKCFFGIQAHCLEDDSAIFRTIGRKAFDFSLRNGLAKTAYFSMHNVVKLFRINFIESSVAEYFTESFKNAYEAREKSERKMNDFIDILMEMKKKGDEANELKLDKIKGVGFQFFIAGFETTSSIISFTLYELSLQKHIQHQLRKEILENVKENNGFTYEGIMGMKYLDMCVKETLRKYPVLPFLDRRCMSDYKLSGTDLVIEKGTAVYIPLFGLHHDEKYFPEPEKYIPQRFEHTNYNTDGLVFLPFGDGPRVCIGERFGLLSTKLGLVSVLSKFEVDTCNETPDPIPWEAKSLVLQSKVGLPLSFRRLESR